MLKSKFFMGSTNFDNSWWNLKIRNLNQYAKLQVKDT